MGAWADILGRPKEWRRDLAVSTGMGVALSLIGPFGSYDAPYLQRLSYCLGIGWVGSLAFFPAFRLAMAAARRARWPYWPAILAACLAATIPLSALVWVVGPFLWRGHWERPAQGPLVLYAQVLSLVFPVTVVAGLVRTLLARNQATPATPRLPRLAARLPATVGREILALEAEDHYVRVHTERGSTLLLMRMADAVAELDELEGMRVHRSWWVAKAAVRACARDGRRMVLTLADGSKAPVTREAAPQLRRAGWV